MGFRLLGLIAGMDLLLGLVGDQEFLEVDSCRYVPWFRVEDSLKVLGI